MRNQLFPPELLRFRSNHISWGGRVQAGAYLVFGASVTSHARNNAANSSERMEAVETAEICRVVFVAFLNVFLSLETSALRFTGDKRSDILPMLSQPVYNALAQLV